MAGIIEQYIANLRRELDFDPSNARRLIQEAEAHLWDAAEADPTWPSPEAEQRAVARFGLAREIAAEFAKDAVERRARRTWLILLVTVGITFFAMRLRVIWFSGRSGSLSGLAPLIDRYAFVAAITISLIGWLAYRRSPLPPALCLGGLGASIAAGLVRVDLFAGGAPLAVLLTAAGEAAMLGLLSWHIAGFYRSIRRTHSLRTTL